MNPVLERFHRIAALSAGRSSPYKDSHSVLRVTSERSGSAVIVSVGGEVDAYNEDAWRNLLTKMAGTIVAPGLLVVDVHDLRFMGCCAFDVLGQEARRCRCRGVTVCLVSNQPIVSRVVDAAGLRPLLPMHSTVEEALSRVTADPSDL